MLFQPVLFLLFCYFLGPASGAGARAGRTEDRLRLTQTRYDELVVRATEVTLGADTDDYAHAVDDLVVELEGMRLALDEVTEADS